MINLFNLFKTKKTVVVELDRNVKLTVTPVTGGVNAELETVGDIFIRNERAFFSSIDELVNSLQLSDNVIIKKLSKAF